LGHGRNRGHREDAQQSQFEFTHLHAEPLGFVQKSCAMPLNASGDPPPFFGNGPLELLTELSTGMVDNALMQRFINATVMRLPCMQGPNQQIPLILSDKVGA
jgi:hypothetical protein